MNPTVLKVVYNHENDQNHFSQLIGTYMK